MIHHFSFTQIHLNISSAKWRPFCRQGNELRFFCVVWPQWVVRNHINEHCVKHDYVVWVMVKTAQSLKPLWVLIFYTSRCNTNVTVMISSHILTWFPFTILVGPEDVLLAYFFEAFLHVGTMLLPNVSRKPFHLYSVRVRTLPTLREMERCTQTTATPFLHQHTAVAEISHTESEIKWPSFRRRHFHMHFLEWKCMNFDWHFTEVCSHGSNLEYSSIGSDNGLAPPRRQAIIWTNVV